MTPKLTNPFYVTVVASNVEDASDYLDEHRLTNRELVHEEPGHDKQELTTFVFLLKHDRLFPQDAEQLHDLFTLPDLPNHPIISLDEMEQLSMKLTPELLTEITRTQLIHIAEMAKGDHWKWSDDGHDYMHGALRLGAKLLEIRENNDMDEFAKILNPKDEEFVHNNYACDGICNEIAELIEKLHPGWAP